MQYPSLRRQYLGITLSAPSAGEDWLMEKTLTGWSREEEAQSDNKKNPNVLSSIPSPYLKGKYLKEWWQLPCDYSFPMKPQMHWCLEETWARLQFKKRGTGALCKLNDLLLFHWNHRQEKIKSSGRHWELIEIIEDTQASDESFDLAQEPPSHLEILWFSMSRGWMAYME